MRRLAAAGRRCPPPLPFCRLRPPTRFATIGSLHRTSLLGSMVYRMTASSTKNDSSISSFTARKVRAVPTGLPTDVPGQLDGVGDALPRAGRRRRPLRGSHAEARPPPRPLRRLLYRELRSRPHLDLPAPRRPGVAEGAGGARSSAPATVNNHLASLGLHHLGAPSRRRPSSRSAVIRQGVRELGPARRSNRAP